MTWRRSRTNAQTIRTLRRMQESLRRAEDERIAQLTARSAALTGATR